MDYLQYTMHICHSNAAIIHRRHSWSKKCGMNFFLYSLPLFLFLIIYKEGRVCEKFIQIMIISIKKSPKNLHTKK